MRPCAWIQSYALTCGSVASASSMQVGFRHGCASKELVHERPAQFQVAGQVSQA